MKARHIPIRFAASAADGDRPRAGRALYSRPRPALAVSLSGGQGCSKLRPPPPGSFQFSVAERTVGTFDDEPAGLGQSLNPASSSLRPMAPVAPPGDQRSPQSRIRAERPCPTGSRSSHERIDGCDE